MTMKHSIARTIVKHVSKKPHATYGAIILLSLILTRLTSGKSYRSD
jgi:hypothetical protein